MERKAPSSRQRLFLALDLTDEARERIVDWQHSVLGGHGRALRPVRPEALHVTLVFLGHVDEDPVGVVAATAFGRVGGPAPELDVQGTMPIPPRHPRLWALDLADVGGRAGAVQAAISTALADRGLYTPEKRPFWPHITVARLRANARAPRLALPPPAVRFASPRAVLYRSHLSRAGAEYEALSYHDFPAPA